MYDSHGGLERVMLPRGNVISTWSQSGLGHTKIGVQLPGHSEPHVTMLDITGHMTQVRPPGGDGVIIYR